jgi:hypothetical protein
MFDMIDDLLSDRTVLALGYMRILYQVRHRCLFWHHSSHAFHTEPCFCCPLSFDLGGGGYRVSRD